MNSSFNSNDLVSYPNQPFCFRPFPFESNQSSKLQHSNSNYTLPPPPPPSSLSFFQLDNCENSNIFLHHDFLHQHHQSLPEITDLPPPVPPSIPPPMDRQVPPRRRSSKRDRHSKINTARGLRDRRMRLSLEVAKRFFGLQDMLGFDKASKTVEWLLNQAKVEIKQIAKSLGGCGGSGGGGAKSASSTSECEGVSSLEEVVVSEINQEKEREKPLHVRRRASKVCRKSALNSIGKESRERARERARERTRQKLRTRRLATESNLMNRLSFNWINPFETVEESATHTQSANHPSLLVEIEEQASCHANKEHLGTAEEDMLHQDTSFVIMSTMMLNSLSNSSNSILHEHQFAEFQSLGKPCWEAYDNHI